MPDNDTADNLLHTVARLGRSRAQMISAYLKLSMGESLIDYIDTVVKMQDGKHQLTIPYTARLAALVSLVQRPGDTISLSENEVNAEAARLTDEWGSNRTSDEGSQG